MTTSWLPTNYRKNLTLNILLFSLIFISACTERFRPELTDFQNNLVVDGQITNASGPYKVKLSLSSDLDIIQYIPLKNAAVKILEEGGESETLTEIEPGEYATAIDGIQGSAGKSYKLSIVTAEGDTYESDYQLLHAAPAIANVYAEVKNKYFVEDNAESLGYQFYVDSEPVDDAATYLLWLTEATFRYEASTLIDFTFSDGTVTPFPEPASLFNCWRTDSVSNVTTYNTADFTDTAVEGVPLHFIKSTDISLSKRYSPLVKQYSLSKEAYDFWTGIAAQLASDAALYTTQPYQIRGNVQNIAKSDEPVLGFFLVAGVTEKRVFVNPPPETDRFERNCFHDYMGYGDLFLGASSPIEWPIYISIGADGRGMMPSGCLDCRDDGGDVVEPDFWEE
ncbi:MAG: hypothetical protein ACI85O_001350 [Saprospiraceae bacterium]|jgi:hypothetical protein